MSNTQTARGRKEWMPNRMFDPVSNPFAIQNLLEKKVETFVAQPDERAEAVFSFDSVVMANPVHAFSEQTLEDPAAGEAQEFQADWMDAGHAFAGDPQTVSDAFVAGQDRAATGFSAVAEPAADADTPIPAVAGTDRDPQAMPADADDAVAVAAQAATAEADTALPAEAEAGAEAIATNPDTAVVEAPANDLAHAAQNGDASTEATEVAKAAEVADAEADAVAALETDAEAKDTEEAAETVPADAVAMAAADSAAAQAVPVAERQGISDDELNARLAAAREEGRAEVREAVRAEAHQQGYDAGQAAGYAQAREELGREYEDKCAQLQGMIDAMQQLSYNPDAMFEPMKMLSVHIAEQLVRGELTQSPQAISRLVDNCLRELNASGEKAVLIHLHPEDLEQYKPQAVQFGDALMLRADPRLERGSVRASLEGSVVEDLIQRRIAGLKKGLMQAPAPSWRANAGRLSDRIAEGQRGSQQVEDITVTTARKDAELKSEAQAAAKPGPADALTEGAVTSTDSGADNAHA